MKNPYLIKGDYCIFFNNLGRGVIRTYEPNKQHYSSQNHIDELGDQYPYLVLNLEAKPKIIGGGILVRPITRHNSLLFFSFKDDKTGCYYKAILFHPGTMHTKHVIKYIHKCLNC